MMDTKSKIIFLIHSIIRAIYGICIMLLVLFGLLTMLLHIPLHMLQFCFEIKYIMSIKKPLYVFYGYNYVQFILEYLCGIKYHIYVSPPTYHYLEEFKSSKDPGLFNHALSIIIIQYIENTSLHSFAFLPNTCHERCYHVAVESSM